MERPRDFFGKSSGFLVAFFLIFGCEAHQNRTKEAEAIRNLGEAYYIEGSYYRAYEEFTRAERMNPRDPQLHNDMGLAYLALEKPELAARHFQRALSLEPHYGQAKNNLATSLMAMGDWQGAIEILLPLSEDLGYGSTRHYAYANLAWAYYNLKENDKALYYCKRALSLNDTYLPALRTKAAVYMVTGDSKNAYKTVDIILRMEPEDAVAWMQKGKLLEIIGEFSAAYLAYSQAKRIGKDTEIEKNAESAIHALPFR